MNFSKEQELLYHWLSHHGIRSYQQIKKSCNDILASSMEESPNGIYRLFFPMFRSGIIEFVGDDKYSLTPTTLLSKKNTEHFTCVNPSPIQLEEAQVRFDCVIYSSFLIKIINPDFEELCKLFPKSNTVWQEVWRANRVLINFPEIAKVVTAFEKVDFLNRGVQFDVRKMQWKPPYSSDGLFKETEEAQKIILSLGDSIYAVPDKQLNPDSRPIAECAIISKGNHQMFTYNTVDNVLRFHFGNLPIAVERILVIENVFDFDQGFQLASNGFFKNVDPKTIKQLNRIFNTNTTLND
jgi:hypothetical protein